MLKMKISVVDSDKVMKALKKLDDNIQVATSKFMKGEGADMEREIKMSMQKGGRIKKGVRGGKKVRIHSQPGQPPFRQSGDLVGSIAAKIQTAINAMFLDIGAIRGGKEVNYAHGLEVGTSKMAARPWLMPIVKKHIDSWGKNLGIKVRVIKP